MSGINDDVLNGFQFNANREISAGSGAIISIGQNVIRYFTGSGTIISVEQNVKSTASGAIINICQSVEN